MEDREDEPAAYPQPPEPSSHFSHPHPPPPHRTSNPLPNPVYTPYNPFLHTQSTSPYPSTIPAAPPLPYARGTFGSEQVEGEGVANAASPASTRGSGSGPTPPTLSDRPAERGNASTSAGGPDDGDGGAKSLKADRSCKTCRQRRVRCGREFPTCSRCRKRRDECTYGEGVFVEETVEGSDQARIGELEAKIASLELRLRAENASTTSRPTTTGSTTSSTAAMFGPLTSTSIAQTVTSLLSSNETATMAAYLSDEQVGGAGLSPRGVDSRLSGNALNDALTCYFLDAAARACDSKLAAFLPLTSRIQHYKARLVAGDLDPAGQVSVAVLCALGARTSAHQAIFGIPSVQIDGIASPPLFLAVGFRRDSVCRALESRARETAWATGLLWARTHSDLEALVGLVGLGFHEENKPEDIRFLVRQAVGAFVDLVHGEMVRGISSTSLIGIATAIFLADAVSAVRCNKPAIITSGQLADYFSLVSFAVPDLLNTNLTELVNERLTRQLDSASINSLLDTIFLHVFSCYRVVNQVISPRRSNSATIATFVRSLWALLDNIHGAIQRLQQHLVGLSGVDGAADDAHLIDHAVLLSVRADDSLVVLIFHVHSFLMATSDEELEPVRRDSTLRVYKVLKLLAFYCQLHCSSVDKHNSWHLLTSLDETLPDWTTMVSLRIGQPGGPLTSEFEVSEEEWDWFRQALELSSFFSPRTAPTLSALSAARRAYFPLHSAPPPPTPMPAPSLSHSHSHSHSPALSQYQPTSAASSYSSSHTPLGHRHSSMYSTPSSQEQQHSSASYPSQQHISHHEQPHQHHEHQQQQQPDVSLPFPLELYGQAGFADGAGEHIESGGDAGDVRTAFNNAEWLTLTPAVGSDESSSSLEEWMRQGKR